jgi:hypothetical protein
VLTMRKVRVNYQLAFLEESIMSEVERKKQRRW